MNIGTLIALAARRVFEDNEQRMGVRLSPVTLSASEMRDAVKELRTQLGAKAYLVGSAPGVDAKDLDARCFTAPDQRAAERATLWRNRVKVGEGERLVYVSVESHAKANGLRDCLEQLRERDLRDAFREWASKKGTLPAGLVEALDESELLGAVRLSALCAFADRVTSGGQKGASAWQAAGQALPLLNLVTDSRLGKEDAADRLRANHAMVRTVEMGEGRRRSTSGPLADIEESLQSSLTGSSPRAREKALAAADLGAVKTASLGRAKPPKARESKPGKAPGAPESGRTSKPPKAPTDNRPGRPSTKQGDATPVDMMIAATNPAAPGAGSGAPHDSDATDISGPPSEAVSTGAPAPNPDDPTTTKQPRPQRAVRLPGHALPKGLAALITTLLDGAGDPAEVRAKTSGRAFFEELPKTVTPTVCEAQRSRERLSAPFLAWADARRSLLEHVRAAPGYPSLADALTRGLDLLLGDASFAAALERLVDASVALYAAAGDLDERTMREVLTLDTVALRGADGVVAMRVIGPLHLLSIGQSLVARKVINEARELPPHAQRLITRALEVAPPAPGSIPDDLGDLPLARGVSGLLVYERVPELVSSADASAAACKVVQRYLAVCPHALLNLRVALSGPGDLGAFIEGVLQALIEAQPRPERVELLCARPSSFNDKPLREGAFGDTEVTIGALDEAGARSAHIALRYAGALGAPEDDEAAPPTLKTFAPPGSPRTVFDLRPQGLRVLTSVAGSRELTAVEALTARAAGMLPRGAFVMNVAGRSLRAECECVSVDGGWLAVVGRAVGRRAPPGWYLIAHEGVGARATCAVVSREVRAAARSLQEGLASLGVSEMRPRSLLLLAERLSSVGRSSLVPLARPAASLVLSGLLGMELRKSLGDGDALIAPITGAVYETLLQERDTDDGTLQIAAARLPGAGIRFAVGYAASSATPDIVTEKAQFDGAIAKRLHRVLDAISLASQGERVDAGAAREALAWALWSAIAADDAGHEGWREELARWTGAVAAPTDAFVLVKAADGRGQERAGKIGRARAVVRPLAIDRLNAMLLGGK